MALLRKGPGTYYVRRNGPGDYQLGTHKQALAHLRQSPEKTLEDAAQIRAEGLLVTAVDNSGGSLDRGDAPIAPIDETVVWPSNWRIPIVHGNQKYYHSFYDQQSASTQTLTGSSPQDLVNRFNDLYHADAKVTHYLDSLPRVQDPAPIAKPVPVAPTVPGRVLRPGSVTISEDEMLELEAERAEREQYVAKPPANFEYEEFYSFQSAKEIQKRAKIDPAFLAWVESSAPTSSQS
jgi:hypothetical protein